MKAVLIKQKSLPGIPRRSPIERIEETINQYNPDLIVAPEYFMNNERRIYTREEKEGLVKRIADVSGGRLIVPGTILWQEDGLMRNTAVAVSEGKVLAEHDKSTNGGDTLIAQIYGLSVLYGKCNACMFQWRDLDVGLEICVEHGLELLKEKGKKVDLQIVPAHGGVLRKESICLKNKRYAIACDGRRPHTSEIRQRSGLIVPDYEPLERESNDNVFIYELFPEGR